MVYKYKGRPLIKCYTSHGYFVVNAGHREYVHRLVAKAFIPNPQNKTDINHKNGIKTDNRLDNLEWVTRGENTIHRYRTLGVGIGESHYDSKLKETDILDIRTMYSMGASQKNLAECYSVTPSNIRAIVIRKSWKHIP